MANAIDKIKALAEALSTQRAQITEVEASQKATLEPMKAKRDELQAELLATLQKHDLASIKTGSGENYSRSKRNSLAITSEAFALKWATENHAVRVDSRLCEQKLKAEEKLPAGFEWTTTEFISIRKPKAAGDNAQGDE